MYLNSGEDYLTSLEFFVSNVWSTKFGILLERKASSTTIESQPISIPRLFSLSHPLDEMCPVLIKSYNGAIGYLTESDYKVIFADAENDLVLLYDNKIGKHFVSKLRVATDNEKQVVCVNDSMADMTSNPYYDLMQSNSFKLTGNIISYT